MKTVCYKWFFDDPFFKKFKIIPTIQNMAVSHLLGLIHLMALDVNGNIS